MSETRVTYKPDKLPANHRAFFTAMNALTEKGFTDAEAFELLDAVGREAWNNGYDAASEVLR